MFSEATYSNDPEEFRQRRTELRQQMSAELATHHAKISAVLNAHREQGTPLPDIEPFKDEHDQQQDLILEKYRQLLAQLHAEYQVPVLQSWQKALAETGKAVFYQEQPRYEGQQLQATVVQCGEQITFSYQETYTFPTKDYPTRLDVDKHLHFRGITTSTWEAVPPAQTIAINNEVNA